MNAAVDASAPGVLRQAAEAIVARYPSAAPRESEAAIALLALWVLDVVESRRLDREEANRLFVLIDIGIGDQPGPELSDPAGALITEGEHFHHFGEQWGAEPAELRRLAFEILQPS